MIDPLFETLPEQLPPRQTRTEFRPVFLDAAGPLPENFYVSHAMTPRAAIRDMGWAINTYPCNVAFWTPPAALVDPAMLDSVGRLFAESPKAFEGLKFEQTKLERPKRVKPRFTAMRRRFERAAESAALQEHGALIRAWGAATVDMLHALCDVERGIVTSAKFSAGDSRNTARLHPAFHIDGNTADTLFYTSPAAVQKSYRNRARLLWNQYGPGVACLASADATMIEYDPAFHRNGVTVYMPPPGTLTLLSHIGWNHDPIIHSTPFGLAQKDRARLLWDIQVSFFDGFDMNDHRRWLDEQPTAPGLLL